MNESADNDDDYFLLRRETPNGRKIALQRFIFTIGLLVDVTADSYGDRYCYDNFFDAAIAALEWNGEGDPPGPWLKHKGRGIDRPNPKFFKGVKIVRE